MTRTANTKADIANDACAVSLLSTCSANTPAKHEYPFHRLPEI